MSSDQSSSSPEPEISSSKAPNSSKNKSKEKDKPAQPAVVHTPHGKNEGTNPDWAYKPPTGSKLVDGELDEDFDWGSLKDSEDLELWIVRVPEGVRVVCVVYHVSKMRTLRTRLG
jgi:hypothetical protein